MQTDHKIFEDIAKMASGAAGSITHFKGEMEQIIRQKMESYLSSMNLATRDELNAVKKMAANARDDTLALRAEIEALTKKIKQK